MAYKIEYPIELEDEFDKDYQYWSDDVIDNANDVIDPSPDKSNTGWGVGEWATATIAATSVISTLASSMGNKLNDNNKSSIIISLSSDIDKLPTRLIRDNKILIPQGSWESYTLDEWSKTNVSLIKNITAEHAQEISQIIRGGLISGKSTDEITKALKFGEAGKAGVYDKFKNRARLIARDQIGKLQSNINKTRLTQMGLDRYIWVTQGDKRVRELHRIYSGNEFRWSIPPSDGHPGEAIQCRCSPSPVI